MRNGLRVLAFAPRNLLRHNAVLRAGHPTYLVNEPHRNVPKWHDLGDETLCRRFILLMNGLVNFYENEGLVIRSRNGYSKRQQIVFFHTEAQRHKV